MLETNEFTETKTETMPLRHYVSIMSACSFERRRMMGLWANAAKSENHRMSTMLFWAQEIERLNDAQWWIENSEISRKVRITLTDVADALDRDITDGEVLGR